MSLVYKQKSHLVKNIHKMDHRDRGYAVIINNKIFEGSDKERKGTDNDRDAMKELLISMGFQDDHIITRNNCTIEEMKEAMDEAADKYDHEDADYDCFVGVILSHGNKDGNVLGRLNNAIAVADLTEPFRGVNCKALSGKPKIFFIQMCRGPNVDEGAQMTHHDDDSGHNECHELFVPSESEFLLAFSAVSGYKSFRKPDGSGSFFIQTVVNVFRRDEQWKREDLLSMLTEVNKIIAFDCEIIKTETPKKETDGGMEETPETPNEEANIKEVKRNKLMPCFVSMLTRKVIFSDKPKDVGK